MEAMIPYVVIMTPILIIAAPLFLASAVIARSAADISKTFAYISLWGTLLLMAVYSYAGYAMSLETSREEAWFAMMPFLGAQLMVFGVNLVLISRANDIQEEEKENERNA